MKILLIATVYLPHIGGIELYVNRLAKYFVQKGNDVVVLDASRFVKEYSQEACDGIKILHFPVLYIKGMTFLINSKYKRMLVHQLEEADIVHLNDVKFLYRFLTKRKAKYGYKLYFSSHGFIFHTKSFLFLKNLYIKHMAKYSPCYEKNYCVSQQDEQIAKQFFFQNTELLIPGTDIHKFDGTDATSFEQGVLLYWGRLAPNKGILDLLRKFKTLPKEYSLLLVGEGDDKEYLSKIDALCRDCTNIHRLGFKNDFELNSLVRRAEFLVFPSLHEGFGMSLVEALSSGKKIIANNIPTFHQILKECNAEFFIFDFCSKGSSLMNQIQILRDMNFKKPNLYKYSMEFVADKILTDYRQATKL